MNVLQFFVNSDQNFVNRPQNAHTENGRNGDEEKHQRDVVFVDHDRLAEMINPRLASGAV